MSSLCLGMEVSDGVDLYNHDPVCVCVLGRTLKLEFPPPYQKVEFHDWTCLETDKGL